jgi:hypothetical protein
MADRHIAYNPLIPILVDLSMSVAATVVIGMIIALAIVPG